MQEDGAISVDGWTSGLVVDCAPLIDIPVEECAAHRTNTVGAHSKVIGFFPGALAALVFPNT